MTLIGEPESLENKIQYYTYTLMPFILGVTYMSVLFRMCQALEFTKFLSVVTGIGFICAYPMMYFFIHICDLGYLGVGVSLSLIPWLMIIGIIISMIKYGFKFIFIPLSFSVVANKEEIKQLSIRIC